MNSFDQALKFLAQHNPRDFIRFALGDPNVDILKPLPTGLPARRRDVDGCYLISSGAACDDEPRVAHLEFHRRNQSLDELAIDVTEAQIRLFRRERKRVTSLVWDLYGKRDEPLLETRTLAFGTEIREQWSRGVYLRVNLRAMRWRDFLRNAPPVLWPLIALTMDGAQKEAIVEARDAIAAQKNLGSSERANYVSILWFVAGAEHVPGQLLRSILDEELVMASDYYESVIAKGKVLGILEGEARGILKGEAQGILKGEAQGILKGEAQALATSIVNVLQRRLGSVDNDVRKKILAKTNLKTLRAWHDKAIDAIDAESAQRLVETIRESR